MTKGIRNPLGRDEGPDGSELLQKTQKGEKENLPNSENPYHKKRKGGRSRISSRNNNKRKKRPSPNYH